MDQRRTAQSDIGALNDVGQLVLAKPAPRFTRERCDAKIAEVGADAQPIDLFVRLTHPQPRILSVEIDEIEMLSDRAQLRVRERAHRSNALRAATPQFVDCFARPSMLAPPDVAITRDLARERPMVVPLYEHQFALARREDHDRFGRDRPTGEPLHAGTGTVLPAHQQMVAAMPTDDIGER